MLKISFGPQNSPEKGADSKTCAQSGRTYSPSTLQVWPPGVMEKGQETTNACPGQECQPGGFWNEYELGAALCIPFFLS